ncbi:MAG: hypothetical protein C0594_03360 [Marinilabiliales bacterium]|nr:MAG: hypothetical protein C0594_03360 [Marinilabiliales bacterium]
MNIRKSPNNDDLAVKAFIWGCVSMSIPYIGWIWGIPGLKWSNEALQKESEFTTEKAGKTFATLGKVFSTIGIAANLALLAFMIIYITILIAVVS